MKNISIARTFLIINGLLVVMMSFLGGLSFLIYFSGVQLTENLTKKNELNQLLHSIELSMHKQSAMVRAYVTTGEREYEQEYTKVRSEVEGTGTATDIANSLKNRISTQQFSAVERGHLTNINTYQQEAAQIEIEALSAMKGFFNDGYGNYTEHRTADKEFAMALLYSKKYERVLQSINVEISLLNAAIEQRTENEITHERKKNNRHSKMMDFASFIVIGLVVISYLIIRRKVIYPIVDLKTYSEKIAIGDFDITIKKHFNDEVGALVDAFRKMSTGFQEKLNFVSKIGDGELDTDYEPLSSKDQMGKSLLLMRDRLKAGRGEEEKRKEIERRENWITEGVAKFSEILRENSHNYAALSRNIIVNLVKYMDANQGGLFIINDNNASNIYVELVASYAYGRERKVHSTFDTDEGLIGRVIFEKRSIYLKEIPDNYLKVTSGLGDAPPKSLLIVPLQQNDNVLGVVEIASFKEIQPYEIEFVEKVGESIAATITTTRINERTAALLHDTREQAEALASQEEEMRQNFEMLQHTQETFDATEKQRLAEIEKLKRDNDRRTDDVALLKNEIKGLRAAINQSMLMAELSADGNIIYQTEFFNLIFGKSANQLVGKNYFELLAGNGTESAEIEDIKIKLSEGLTVEFSTTFHFENNEHQLQELLTPVMNSRQQLLKIIKITYHG